MILAGTAAVGALLLMGAPAMAAPKPAVYIGGCANSDVTPTAGACYGFYEKNVNGGNAQDLLDSGVALAALGLTGPYVQLEHIEIKSGNTIDFQNYDLSGTTYISIHWGGGQPSPLPGTSGGVTGFYRLDLADDAQLDTFTTHWGALSNAVLWGTEPCVGAGCDNGGNSVPEPATWAMMIMGFGGVGAVMRRRRYSMTVA
jgi:hypothetical protein